MHRRQFIKHHSLGTLGLAFNFFQFPGKTAGGGNIHFISPIDGDMLHKHDGIVTGETLQALVKIAAPANSVITVNGIQAKNSNGLFTAEIALPNFENTIDLRDKQTGIRRHITVHWLKNLADHYRLSIDDGIWFLKDIHTNSATYGSIFHNPFLAFLKEVHDSYGTKVHINIFYETNGFNLSQMTDRFKNEWRANASWLQLSFHAKAEFPDNPYIHAGYNQVKTECDAVIRQIRRFAGDELTGPVTTLHWGEVPVEVSRALRDAGYTGQLCDFNVADDLPPCSYYLNVEQRKHINKRFLWRDNKEAISFIKSSIIIDTKKTEQIIPYLDQYEQQARKPPYVDLLIHEQYFYPDYHNYQPNYRQKVLTAVKWAVEKGYTPAFIKDCIYE